MTLEEAQVAARRSHLVGPDAARERDLYTCIHCGLCLSACPTYLETGLEAESPRGRLALMRATHEGRITTSEAVISHWRLCLQCRACEAVCPSGVPYGRLMEYTRAQVLRRHPGSLKARLLRRLAFHHLLPHQRRLAFLVRLLRLYQRSGLPRLLSASGLLPRDVASLEAGLPPIPRRFFGPTATPYPSRGLRRGRVALLSGCVMPLLYAEVMEATVRVLTRNGYEVLVPPGQGCCGALNIHAGVRRRAQDMARRNIDAFLALQPDAVVVNSAGCGAAMKEYGELLKDDPVYADRANRFASLVQDVHEFLVNLPHQEGLGEVRAWVTYQDPCHLAHAQRIARAPRDLLRDIPGLELVEMEEASVCCGAAGSYTITQRALSRRLMERKTRHMAETGAGIVATANPGCMLQLQAGLRLAGSPVRVRHVMELLDEAYRRGEEEYGPLQRNQLGHHHRH